MHGIEDITAVILVGGLGTRLRSVVSDRPKVLAEVGGRPFLAYLLDRLANSNIRRVVLCTGYLGEQVRAVFGETYGGMDLVYSVEKEPRGTGGALRLALPLLQSDLVLVMNGDSYCEIDLTSHLEWHKKKEAVASIALTLVENTSRYGMVQLGAHDEIVQFEEKGGKRVPGWINAGIYFIKKSLISSIPSSRNISIEKEVFPAWIGTGFYGYRSNCRFLDIGTPVTYSHADQFFANSIKRDVRQK